jgi:hypothetical protein
VHNAGSLCRRIYAEAEEWLDNRDIEPTGTRVLDATRLHTVFAKSTVSRRVLSLTAFLKLDSL